MVSLKSLCCMKKSEFSFIGDIASMFGTLPHHGFEPIGDDCTVVECGNDEELEHLIERLGTIR